VVEDACQAHLARYRGAEGWRLVGTDGAFGAFSFYPGKNLGAYGEAGAKRILSLPMYPELIEAQIRYVCEHVGRYQK
jgi:dTDP-4-amino-4,6-dideoxygalactose transaminase